MKDQNTYHRQTAKFISTVAQNLPVMSSSTMQKWIENPRALSEVLTKALCPHLEAGEFPVLKSIKLGTHRSVDELRKSIKDHGFRINNLTADDILGKAPIAKSETEVKLHVATAKELTGRDNRVRNSEINEAIRFRGYHLCPAEVGPQLRIQYPEQPKGQWLRIAMEPIADSGGNLSIFSVDRGNDGFWLNSDVGHRDGIWYGDARFVFVSQVV